MAKVCDICNKLLEKFPVNLISKEGFMKQTGLFSSFHEEDWKQEEKEAYTRVRKYFFDIDICDVCAAKLPDIINRVRIESLAKETK